MALRNLVFVFNYFKFGGNLFCGFSFITKNLNYFSFSIFKITQIGAEIERKRIVLKFLIFNAHLAP